MLAKAWRDDRRWVVFGLVATLLGLVGFLGPWSARLIDLDVYRMGAHALLRGQDIYSVVEPKADLVFTYPVFAAVVFVPFAVVPVVVARVAMTLGSFAALFAIVQLSLAQCRRALGRSEEGTLRWSVLLTVGCLGAHPVWDTLNFGQVNLILAALVMTDTLALRGSRWQGVLVGIATGIKLVPGLFILYYLVTGQRRAALVSALTTVGTVAVGFAVAPGPAWDFFTRYALDPGRTGAVYYVTNQSILGVTARLLRDPVPAKALTYALAALAVGVALFVAHRLSVRYGFAAPSSSAEQGGGAEPLVRSAGAPGSAGSAGAVGSGGSAGSGKWVTTADRAEYQLVALCTVALAALLASPISWSHHWVWGIPAAATVALWVLRSPAGSRRWRWWVFGVTAAIFYAGPIYFVPKGGDRELHHSQLQQLAANVYLFLAVAYLVWGLVQVLRSAPVGSTVAVRSTVD